MSTSTSTSKDSSAPAAHTHFQAAESRHVAETPSGLIRCEDVNVYYGDFRAVTGVNLEFGRNEITALIGPSGCGKSTLLRSLNRMNDLVDGARVEGNVIFQEEDIYAKGVDPIEVRRRIGMVFQKPNPFPKSIYDNIAYGPRVTGMKVDNMDDLVEEALTRSALWGEVKDKAQAVRVRALRRPAAASVHRAHHRRAARCDPHGRAVLGPRPHRHLADRRPHARTAQGLHNHHRHPQHAAGSSSR